MTEWAARLRRKLEVCADPDERARLQGWLDACVLAGAARHEKVKELGCTTHSMRRARVAAAKARAAALYAAARRMEAALRAYDEGRLAITTHNGRACRRCHGPCRFAKPESVRALGGCQKNLLRLESAGHGVTYDVLKERSTHCFLENVYASQCEHEKRVRERDAAMTNVVLDALDTGEPGLARLVVAYAHED